MKLSMTEGPEWKCILRFTFPLMIGNLLQQLYNIVDSVIVGNYVSQNALSAVGTSVPLTLIFIALAIGMSVGSGIMCSQYYGAKRREDLRQAVSTSIIMMLAMGVFFTFVGILSARVMLESVMNVPQSILPGAMEYFRIYCVGLLFTFAYNIAAALRSVGDSSSTLYFLIIAAAVNVGLDMLFVAVLDWGVAGAAWATVISQAVSAVVSFIYMHKRHEVLRFKISQLRFFRDKAKLCIKLGVPTTVQQIAVSCGMLLIQRVINSFGEDMIAGMTAGTRAYSILSAPTVAFNNSTSTFAGQNLGAGRVDRVERGARVSQLMCGGFCLVLGAVTFAFAGGFVGLFGVTGAARELGAPYVRMTAALLPIFGAYMCSSGTYRGAGDVTFATSITLGGLFLRTAATYVMALYTPLGAAGVWLGLPFDWLSTTIAGELRYKFGPWRKMGVVGSGALKSI